MNISELCKPHITTVFPTYPFLLNEIEMEWSGRVGKRRHNPLNTFGIKDDLLGSPGELSVSFYFEVIWPALVNKSNKEADIGNIIEVRTTRLLSGGIFLRSKRIRADGYKEHGDENPNLAFVGVVRNPDRLNEFTVVGWIRGEEAMKDKYIFKRENGGVTWCMPQKLLRPIDELKAMVSKDLKKYNMIHMEREEMVMTCRNRENIIDPLTGEILGGQLIGA